MGSVTIKYHRTAVSFRIYQATTRWSWRIKRVNPSASILSPIRKDRFYC